MTPTSPPEPDHHSTPSPLSREADLCVMCGLCLPHCPTYQLTRNEAESPRGRIALIKHLTEAAESLSTSDLAHLDSCLLCRSCEAMCPSGVPFEHIMDESRAALRQQGQYKPAFLANLLSTQLSSKAGRQLLHRAAHWYALTPLPRTIGRWSITSPGWQALNALLPQHQESSLESNPPATTHSSNEDKTVQLFLGCADQIWDDRAVQASQSLLEALGHKVVIQDGQTCCGALSAHDGNQKKAEQLAYQNQAAFSAGQTVVGISTACTSHLKDNTALKVAHILEYLLADPNWHKLEFAPLKRRIATHTPCSQKNGLKQPDLIEDALKSIPGLQITPLSKSMGCCGAAGNYLLRYPETAQTLREPLLNQTEEIQAELLITSNLGCQLHLQSGLKGTSSAVKVEHPATLLARQLISAPL